MLEALLKLLRKWSGQKILALLILKVQFTMKRYFNKRSTGLEKAENGALWYARNCNN